MSRGKRDGILKNEKGRVVVKVGAMHLKGVWITFARAKSLAAQFKISELLYPLFVDDPSIFLHNSYGQSMSTRIPSLNNAPTSQWRPAHHYPNNFNNAPYTPETTRQWYPYGNSNPLMGSPNGPHGQDHGSPYPPAAGGYSERPQNANPPAVPMYSAQPPRNHNAHPQAHLEEYDTGYNLINGQSQGQQGVAVVQGPGTEENNSSNGNGYMRSNGQGLYNLVSATDVVGGSPAQNNSQLIGQKRGYVGDDENDDYNNVNNSSQPSPPLAMHPPPPISGIAVSGAMNVAAGSFPSPMNVSPNSPPGNSAFSGWNPNGKRVKYEFPESTTPPSAPSPRFQLPGLGAGPATPGANPSTPQAYTSSNLQMVTNAQSSPHYSNATNANTTTTNGGPATGTTTPTTEGLDRFFDQGTVLQTPSPENVGNTPTEESNRRYEYRTRDTSEEINHGGWD
ncbi:11342_t:CDS:2 [Diversispora eburnea]|uniref:11342_t:CDS:1 n=1 Tax=Diversispora eburnea TaxID=1213867 RepID=A0A9N8WI91_9GLOM|nr:11342_t:CDS:2 [Diversispora eburnea]